MLSEFADTYAAQGDTAKRDESARKSLAIVEQLSKSDPSNPVLQGDLAIAYEKVGSTLWQAGDLDKALENYRASQAVFERVAKTEPKNLVWQRAVSTTYERLGDVLMAKGDVGKRSQATRLHSSSPSKSLPPYPRTATCNATSPMPMPKSAMPIARLGISNPRSSGTRRLTRSSIVWRKLTRRIPAGRATSAFRMRE